MPSATLVRVFLATCSRHSARVAVIDGATALTYGALEARSRAVAAALGERGVCAGDRVLVKLDRGADACAVLLGVMRAGAAYVPCDPAFPAARIRDIASDAQVRCVIEPGSAGVSPALGLPPSYTPEFLQSAGSGRPAPASEPAPADAAYQIFTSGSTGKPKGVVVSHRAACTFVEGEHRYFDITPDDRIAHGFSLAFDAAVEELWLAWRHGAALVCLAPEIARSPVVLPETLRDSGVTVWSTVPTFLAAVEAELPTLRLLIVGGEACPDDLVRRRARFGIRMVNTYGPTEATVVATAGELVAGRPVTIGHALPGYLAEVADASDGSRIADGAPGELLLGGDGLADGYWGRPDLTAEKFITPAWAGGHRFYRTGDLVSRDAAGEFRYLGRIDDQVKLRGYRVELGEIENRILALPGVTGAAVGVLRESAGEGRLAGYIVKRPDAALDERRVRTLLREQLPAYMVPAHIVFLDALPLLVSGKVDRSRLPRPESPAESPDAAGDSGFSPTEKLLRALWRELLPGALIASDTDFFEIGGHSLVAAKLVTRLRADRRFTAVSVTDVYTFTTLVAFARRLEILALETPAAPAPEPARRDPGLVRRHFFCGLAQLFALYPLLMFAAPAWISAWAVYHLLVLGENELQVTYLVLAGAAAVLGFGPVRMAFAIVVKWLVLGRVKPGRHKLWGVYHFRFWFVSRVLGLAENSSMRGTPWLNFYLRCLGARVAKDAHLETTFIGVPDLLDIGPGAAVGHDASLLGYTVEAGELIIGRITLGAGAKLGSKCLLSPDTRVGDEAELADGTLLSPGQSVPACEIWEGSPARKIGGGEPADAAGSGSGPTGLKLAFALSHLALALFPAIAAAPGAWLLGYVDTEYCDFYEGYADLWKLALAALPAALLYVVCLALLVVAAKWLLLGRVEPGSYPLRSWRRLRHWFVESLMHLSLATLFPFFATVYTPVWLRLLGAKIGAWTEVSTAENMNPDLLRLGSGVFVADAVCLGPSRVRDGRVWLDTVEVGDNTFLGNNGITPGGVRLGPDGLVGVLSKAPVSAEAAGPGRSWLGLPAFPLPRRQQSTDFGEQLTRRPSRRLFLARAFVEFWRIVLPGMLTGFSAFVVFLIADDLVTDDPVSDKSVGYAGLFLLFPVLLLGLGLALTGIALLLKWTVVGRHRASEFPLWSHGVWRAEFAAAMHEHIAMPAIVGLLLGTPFAPWYFRLSGAKFGRRVYCETGYITEPDLVRVADDAALNAGCDLQTHLFEDRVMKMSVVTVGARTSLGAFSVVLYDATVASDANLAGLSLVMKGETATAGALWAGVPATRVSIANARQ